MTDTLDCGHPPTPNAGPGTGYAETPTGARVCYECCRDIDLARMERGDPIVLYLTRSGLRAGFHEMDTTYPPSVLFTVSNWPGSLKVAPTCVKRSKGIGFYGRRYDVYHVWFIGPDDHVWYGRNQGDNQILRCRRTKERLTDGAFKRQAARAAAQRGR